MNKLLYLLRKLGFKEPCFKYFSGYDKTYLLLKDGDSYFYIVTGYSSFVTFNGDITKKPKDSSDDVLDDFLERYKGEHLRLTPYSFCVKVPDKLEAEILLLT